MSSSREHLRLADIIDNIDRIEAYVADLSLEGFARDGKTVDAVERCLQRITEAIIKIGEARMAEIAPSLPVHAVRGLGNALRHDYDRIDTRMIYVTAIESLPLLRNDCRAAIERDVST